MHFLMRKGCYAIYGRFTSNKGPRSLAGMASQRVFVRGSDYESYFHIIIAHKFRLIIYACNDLTKFVS